MFKYTPTLLWPNLCTPLSFDTVEKTGYNPHAMADPEVRANNVVIVTDGKDSTLFDPLIHHSDAETFILGGDHSKKQVDQSFPAQPPAGPPLVDQG
jgi:hypothetical protein